MARRHQHGIMHFNRFIDTRKQVRPRAGCFDNPPGRAQFLVKINEILSAEGCAPD
jgi:hypothetical protein